VSNDKLVGRKAELAVLAKAVDALTSGRPSWARVVGEPGIGKSRLLAAACEMAESRRALVLAGQGTELESDVPYGVVVDALDDYLGSLPGRELDDLCGARLGLLASVFPALAPWASEQAGGFQDERYRSHRAVRALLERLSATRPLVISPDDLHWADPASVELISHLLSHPPAGAVLLLLAWRARQAPRLTSLVASGPGGLPGVELTLGPLSEDRPTESAESALGAVAGFGRAGALGRQARARVLAGQALARAGRPQEAIEQLSRARQALGGFGAQHWAGEAASELRRLGQRVPRAIRRRVPVPAGGLSERESEISQLVARGLTNRDIAAELFISDKTVEAHLSRVFAKLGVSGRAALAAAVGSTASPPAP